MIALRRSDTVPKLSIEDRVNIDALVIEYAWLLDHSRWQDVAGLCTDDAVLTIRGRDIVGQDGLRDWAEHRAQKTARRTLHQMTNLRLEPQDDHVAGVASLVLHIAQSGGHGSYVDLIGEYHDEYVRDGGRWKFRRRNLVRIKDF